MAAGYWNYRSDCTTTSTSDDWSWGDTTASTSNTCYYVTSWSPPPRRMLVETPAHWGLADCAEMTRLLNDETHTDFKVEMVINGDIKIADPSIDMRAMRDFVPLLRQRATSEDRVKIDEFFKTHPLELPAAP